MAEREIMVIHQDGHTGFYKLSQFMTKSKCFKPEGHKIYG